MTFFQKISPTRAARDLRDFLSNRKPYEMWFLLLALAITVGIWWMFVQDSQFERPYKPNIIYVENWPLSRTDREIIDQQKIDLAKKRAREAELAKKRKARQEEYKKIDDSLKRWGI